MKTDGILGSIWTSGKEGVPPVSLAAQCKAVGLGPRLYHVGNRLRDWTGRTGTVTQIQTVINHNAPHHRVKMSHDNSVFGYSEGAESNFWPASFWQVWEGETLIANQSTRDGAEHYMKPGRVLVAPTTYLNPFPGPGLIPGAE